MSKLLRTFVAIRCSAPIVEALRGWGTRLARIDDALRLPRTDDYHLTVQFLGHTAEQDLGAIGTALDLAAAMVEPVEVRYGGLGAFPDAARARVVWAAVTEIEAPGTLKDLASAVGEGLGPLGYPPERRGFHPHVTLGRVRRRPGDALAQAVSDASNENLGSELMSELKLILSEPGKQGYHYNDLTTVELGGVGPLD